jgi:hypothetical protein
LLNMSHKDRNLALTLKWRKKNRCCYSYIVKLPYVGCLKITNCRRLRSGWGSAKNV